MKILELYRFDQALSGALDATTPTIHTEYVQLETGLGRTVASDVFCRKNLPSFDNSAMDGFAFRHEDAGKTLHITATIYAGDKPSETLGEHACYRIMTGAKVPTDADTIALVEDCTNLSSAAVTVPTDIKRGNAFRRKGEEQEIGSVLIRRGESLSFAHIAMLSAQGIMEVEVFSPLKIAVLSTGNEIREPWEEADEDEIYNANAFGITALLAQHGFDAVYEGSLADDLAETVEAIERLKSYDVIMTTGGISMGEADFLEEAFVANGLTPLFHGVNVKPGRPTMMGIMGETFVMAMPGNPMTALLNIFLLSLPVLRKLQGSIAPEHQKIKTQIAQSLCLKPTRTNLVLGRMEEGIFHVTRDNKIGSGMLTPLMESDAVAIFGEGVGEVRGGDNVEVIMIR